ncbi:unnamed protein product [Candidula unifasciata]|uniref:MADF domain-containing protein n=1 Tax=Candidula unifasciata TaxID=100452 RepID=A0A8S3YU86_9EUPU|nr:unnamed protein product [Candidula unifasciata]
MSRLFKYDVATLIRLVESYPCIWDKTADCYKDKIEKLKAWSEVYAFLEEDFTQKDKKEQQKIGEAITGKWQNIRDSFVKSLKKKSGQATKKKYLYHDNLTFLLKVVHSDDTEYDNLTFSLKVEQSEDTESSIDGPQQEQLNETHGEEEAEAEIEVQAQRNVGARPRESWNPAKKPRLQEDINTTDLAALKNTIDEDEAFFISVIPSVRKMSEEDKLDFRINVLKVIQDINRRKNNHPQLTPFSATLSSAAVSMKMSQDSLP